MQWTGNAADMTRGLQWKIHPPPPKPCYPPVCKVND